MSSNLDSRNSSVRDIAKLFPEDKRLGTKASDLVSGTALTRCLDVHGGVSVCWSLTGYQRKVERPWAHNLLKILGSEVPRSTAVLCTDSSSQLELEA